MGEITLTRYSYGFARTDMDTRNDMMRRLKDAYFSAGRASENPTAIKG